MERKLTTDQQIEWLKNKGVTFERMSEEGARSYLSDFNYFYKITAYRQNFEKDSNGKYIELDFDDFHDMSLADMFLSRYLMTMSSAVEHGLQSKLIRQVEENQLDDGFISAEKLKNSQHDFYQRTYEKSVGNLEKTIYQNHIFKKYNPNFPIWALINSSDFQGLSNIINFYGDEYQIEELKELRYLLISTRHIRNAVAHSQQILVGISDRNFYSRSETIKQYARDLHISTSILKNIKVHDIVALFCLSDKVLSPGMIKHFKDDLQVLIDQHLKKVQRERKNAIKPLDEFIDVLQKIAIV